MAYRLLPIVAAAMLALLAGHHPASAGKSWCWSDPIIELNGQVIDVQAYAYANEGQIVDAEYVFTVAPGSTMRLLDPGPDPTIESRIVPGAVNGVTFRVLDSPRLNLKLTVGIKSPGPATPLVTERFGRAISVEWPASGGTIAATPPASLTATATPTVTATATPPSKPTATPIATTEPTLSPTATSEPTLAPTATTEPTPTPTAMPTATQEPTLAPTLEPTPTATLAPTPTESPPPVEPTVASTVEPTSAV